MRVQNKRRNVSIVLVSLMFTLIFSSFIRILPVNKDNPLILPPGTLANQNKPNPYSPVDDGQTDLSTLSDEYPSPAYTGSGPSYTVTEYFNEIVKQGAVQSGLKYGNNINIGLDANYPSQDASKLYGTISQIIEYHPGAFDNHFDSGFEDWTYIESGPAGDQARMSGTYVGSSPNYVRLAFDGIKDPATVTLDDDNGFDGNFNSGANEFVYSESGTSDLGDHSTGSAAHGLGNYGSPTDGYDYRFYLYECGYTTQENHDTWCNYDTVEHADDDSQYFYLTSPSFQHGIHTELGGGSEITGATMYVRWNVHSSNFVNGNNQGYLRVKLSNNGGSSYTTYTLWTKSGSNPSGWNLSPVDVSSVLSSTAYNSNLRIQFEFYVYLYSPNSGDSEDLYCDIDQVYIDIAVNNARTFSANSLAGLESSAIANWTKHTLDANFTFSYRLSANWDDSGVSATAACDHADMVLYMNNSYTGSPVEAWRHSLDDDSLFIKDGNFYTLSDNVIDLTTYLGQYGSLNDPFHFELRVVWNDNWGPLTDSDLTVDLDNLYFQFTASVYPNIIDLNIYDATNGGPLIPVTTVGGPGTGTFDSLDTHSWTGHYKGGSTPNLQWVVRDNSIDGSAQLVISHNAIYMAESGTGTATTQFSCSANATNNWYLDWTSLQKNSDSRTSSEKMDIIVDETDWGTSYVSINPTSHGEVASKVGTNTLRVTNSQSLTSYTFTASSPNILDLNNIANQENSTGTFTDKNYAYPLNYTRLRARAIDAGGYLNMTIMNASRTGPEYTGIFGIEHQQLFSIGTSDSYSTPWQIPLDAMPGKWTYVLLWNNSLTPGQITEVGHATIQVDVRRSTVTTGIVFGREIAGDIGPGNTSINAVNRTLDLDPLWINITWTDLHWSSAVTYYEKACINITGDTGSGPYPYDDRPPYTVVQKNLIRDGNSFYYRITPADYGTWCYTGQHNFTIYLESESTEIDGSSHYSSRYITGSFYIVTNIELTIDSTSSLTEPPSNPMQGDTINLRIVAKDKSHNINVDNESDYIGTQANPWWGLVHANWSLVFPQQYFMFTKGSPIPGANGSLSMIIGGYYGTSFALHTNCDPVGGKPFPEDFYYFNFTVEIMKNQSLNWEAEVTFCKNNTPFPDQEPYTMPNWGRLEVEEAINVWASEAVAGRNNIADHKFDTGTFANPIDYYWYDYDNDYQVLYVHFVNSTKGIHGGFVNSTEYNGTGSGTPLQYEGNATYLRATWDPLIPYGDVVITSRTPGGFGVELKEWYEAIPRWAGDSADIRYAKVPEMLSTGQYTGNLTDWDPNNNLTWGWYYHNFTIHDNPIGDYVVTFQCEKKEQYWENETAEQAKSGALWSWRDAIKPIVIEVKPNPINFVVMDNSLIAKGYGAPTDRFTYYWDDLLTINVTAWDVLNNASIPVTGVPIGNATVFFELYQQGIGKLDVTNYYMPNRTTNENYYNVTLNTGFINNEQEHFWLQIYGLKTNYSVDHQGLPYLRYDFDLRPRLTTATEGTILGLFSDSRTTEDILQMNVNRSYSFGSTFYIPVNRTFDVTIRYVDTSPRDAGPINDAVSFVNVSDLSKTSFFLTEKNFIDTSGNNGYYNFTIDTTGLYLKETYKFTLTTQKYVTGTKNYEINTFTQNSKDINVKIMPVPVVMEQSYLLGANYFPIQGQSMRVVVKLYDPTTGDLLSGALIWYNLLGPDINPFLPIQGPMIEIMPGYYVFELDTWTELFNWRPGGTYVFEAKVMSFAGDPQGKYGTFEDYRSAMFSTADNSALFINVNSYGAIGPMTTSLLLGLVGAIIVGGVFSSYQLVKLISIPYALRKIDDSLKKIKRRRKTYAGIMKSREQQIVEEAEAKLTVFGVKLEPISAKKLPPPITKLVKEKVVEKELPLLTEEQIKAELDAIPELSAEEKILFLKEIKGLSASDQREFIAGLKGESKEELKEEKTGKET